MKLSSTIKTQTTFSQRLNCSILKKYNTTTRDNEKTFEPEMNKNHYGDSSESLALRANPGFACGFDPYPHHKDKFKTSINPFERIILYFTRLPYEVYPN